MGSLIILVAPVVADTEGGLGTLQPVAHEGDLRIQLVAQMRTGTRQPVAHEVADKDGGKNILFEEDTQGSPRQNPSRSRLLVPHLVISSPDVRVLNLEVHHSLHKGKIHQRLQKEN